MTIEKEIERLSLRGERWVRVKAYDRYFISDHGRIISTANGVRILKTWKNHNGYVRIHLSKNNREKGYAVHRLVAEGFLPAPEAGCIFVGHLDGSRDNNHFSNLQWITPKTNMEHRIDHGTYLFGERHPVSKLSESQVKTIRKQYKRTGYCQSNSRELAQLFGVTKTTINNIVAGKYWKGHPLERPADEHE